MKAGRIHYLGPPNAIAIDEIPCPTPQEGELVVRAAAAGVGPWDALIREGIRADISSATGEASRIAGFCNRWACRSRLCSRPRRRDGRKLQDYKVRRRRAPRRCGTRHGRRRDAAPFIPCFKAGGILVSSVSPPPQLASFRSAFFLVDVTATPLGTLARR